MKISFLGPKGTFTEQASIRYMKDSERIPFGTVQEALKAVEDGFCQRCVAPIENSIEGAVNATIDALVFDRQLFIEKLIILPIIQNIMVKKGSKKEDVKKIISHPQALAQCRHYLGQYFEGVIEQAVSSTAEAARIVSLSDGSVAAIGSDLTADIYGLDILVPSAQDSNTNRTSFIAVTKEDTSKPKAGCITSIAFSVSHKPGELYKILDIFSLWDINMNKIISRPMRDKPGEYIFFIDIENGKEDDVADALQMVRRKTGFLKVLGTYPVEDYAAET